MVITYAGMSKCSCCRKCNQFGYAQAKAILFFIILACVSLVQVRISNKREVEM